MKVYNVAPIWLDVDRGWGRRNTKIMRETYPDGFQWKCCKKVGTAKGCKVGPHEAKLVPEKKKTAAPVAKKPALDTAKPVLAKETTVVPAVVPSMDTKRAPLSPKMNESATVRTNSNPTPMPNSYLDLKTNTWVRIGSKPGP
jgi:hypothetical protein